MTIPRFEELWATKFHTSVTEDRTGSTNQSKNHKLLKSACLPHQSLWAICCLFCRRSLTWRARFWVHHRGAEMLTTGAIYLTIARARFWEIQAWERLTKSLKRRKRGVGTLNRSQEAWARRWKRRSKSIIDLLWIMRWAILMLTNAVFKKKTKKITYTWARVTTFLTGQKSWWISRLFKKGR